MKSSGIQCLRCFVSGLVGVPLLLALVLLVSARLWLPSIGQWLSQPACIDKADAIVVLSGGGPNRLIRGIALYKQGLAPELWYTGDMPVENMTRFTDGRLARQFALDDGVPEDAIHLLPTTSTWEDGIEIAALAENRQIRSILLVTSWYHSRRSLSVIRHHLGKSGIEVYFSASDNVSCGPENWWQSEEGLVAVVNELIKFGYYWWRYGLVPGRLII